MKNFRLFIPILFLALSANFISKRSFADPVRVFTIEDFYLQILENHPVARQAALLSDQARQQLRIARGMMDPVINSNLYRKELQGSNYFTLWDNAFRIPLWFGADIKAGYERNTGFNVSGENFTPPLGLTTVGFVIPLAQGLLIDQRRAAIKQAQLLGDLAEADRVVIINNLLLQATNDYWDWVYAYNSLLLNEEGFELAQFRLGAVKERAIEGNLPMVGG
jgi:outer membrane protein TolC